MRLEKAEEVQLLFHEHLTKVEEWETKIKDNEEAIAKLNEKK